MGWESGWARALWKSCCHSVQRFPRRRRRGRRGEDWSSGCEGLFGKGSGCVGLSLSVGVGVVGVEFGWLWVVGTGELLAARTLLLAGDDVTVGVVGVFCVHRVGLTPISFLALANTSAVNCERDRIPTKWALSIAAFSSSPLSACL